MLSKFGKQELNCHMILDFFENLKAFYMINIINNKFFQINLKNKIKVSNKLWLKLMRFSEIQMKREK